MDIIIVDNLKVKQDRHILNQRIVIMTLTIEIIVDQGIHTRTHSLLFMWLMLDTGMVPRNETLILLALETRIVINHVIPLHPITPITLLLHLRQRVLVMDILPINHLVKNLDRENELHQHQQHGHQLDQVQ